jgi:hypothetical protein
LQYEDHLNHPDYFFCLFCTLLRAAPKIDRIAVDENSKSTILNVDSLPATGCDLLRQRGNSYVYYGKYRWGYDSLRFYIEQCAMQPNSKSEFSTITTSASGLAGIQEPPGSDTVYVWKEYKQWLKDVLNLNPYHQYFCTDVFEMASIYGSFSDTSNTISDWNALVTISKFAEDSLCPSWKQNFDDLIKRARHLQHKQWQDTVTDSLKTPLDTSLKSLDDLNLGYLRQYTNGVAALPSNNEEVISTLKAIKNPFDDEIELRYSLSNGSAIRIDVYDVLGKQMFADGQGYHSAGQSTVKIDSKNWMLGTYYARLTTSSNETKSIVLKLIR